MEVEVALKVYRTTHQGTPLGSHSMLGPPLRVYPFGYDLLVARNIVVAPQGNRLKYAKYIQFRNESKLF